jgi:hypothetical protein
VKRERDYGGNEVEKITVQKSELLDKLKQNREDHRRIFEEALDGFFKESQDELQARIEDLRVGKRRNIYISKPVPVDHTFDYDRAIGMIEMAVGDTITLSEEDFAQFVMDDWGWQRLFLAGSYNSSTARSKFGVGALDG